MLARYADMPAVSASVLGPPWRGASAGQKQAFVAAFQGYLVAQVRRAVRRVPQRPDRGDRRPRRRQGRGAGADPGGAARARRRSRSTGRSASAAARPRVVNLVIEGVSMLANERAEVGAMLEASRGNIDGLIGQLRGAAPDAGVRPGLRRAPSRAAAGRSPRPRSRRGVSGGPASSRRVAMCGAGALTVSTAPGGRRRG